MDYDPIKDRLGALAARSPLAQRALFRALDTLFLRAWYVYRATDRLLARLPPDGPVEVLDAGTGFGQYAWRLLHRDPRVRVTAVDVKADYLARAERLFGRAGLGDRVTFRVHDLTAAPPATAAFDLALCVDVLEHIEDDRAALRHLAEALRPGGALVVHTPSDRGGSDTAGGREGFIGEHVRDGYAPDELAAKLDAAGLEVVEWTYTYGRYGAAAWRLLVRRPMRLLGRSRALAPLLVPYYAVAGPVGWVLHALDLRAERPEGTGLLMVGRRRVDPAR